MGSDEAGFNVVELLVSTLIVSLVFGGLVVVLFQGQATFDAEAEKIELRQGARISATRLTTELRMAGFGVKNVPEVFWVTRSDQLDFAADIDVGNESLPCTHENDPMQGVERVSYRLASGNLVRSVRCWNRVAWTSTGGAPDQTMVADVQTDRPVFRYFDESGVELIPDDDTSGGLDDATRAQVTLVLVDLGASAAGADPVFGTSGAPTLRIPFRIRLRNPNFYTPAPPS